VNVGYGWWLQYALWPLDDAVLLLCEIDPKAERASLLKEAFKRDTEPNDEGDREVYATYRKAESAIHASVLVCEDNEVRPLEFLRWARRHRFPLPEELAAFLISKDKKPQAARGEKGEKPLTESERNSLLKMILGMARAKYGYDSKRPRNPATGGSRDSIYEDLQKYELDVSVDTIHKYLKEVSDKFGKPSG
jgi:hypothetical protein